MTWKVLSWARCLQEFGACIWFDASVEMTKTYYDLVDKYIYERKQSFLFTIHETYHTNIYSTHPEMFAYFPSPYIWSQSLQQQSGCQIFYNTPEMKEMMKFMVACALTPQCMYPADKIRSSTHGLNSTYNLGHK